jgi:hypothetical protein
MVNPRKAKPGPQPEPENGNNKVEWPIGEETHLSSVAVELIQPTEANIREIRSRIEEAFNAMGTDQLPGTIIPQGRSNNAREAADFVIADMLRKLAEGRMKNATEAAEKAGVFGDPEAYVEGDTVMVFSDPNFSINIKMGKPSKMIKRENVEAAIKAYVPQAKQSEALEACFGTRAATVQRIVSMK